jgi:hypothetical protein
MHSSLLFSTAERNSKRSVYLEAAGFGDDRIRMSGLSTERGERFAGVIVDPNLT